MIRKYSIVLFTFHTNKFLCPCVTMASKTWQEYPTVLVVGTVLKLLNPSLSIEQIRKEAEKDPECQSFTSNGQLLTDIEPVSTWIYNNNITSYINPNYKKTERTELPASPTPPTSPIQPAKPIPSTPPTSPIQQTRQTRQTRPKPTQALKSNISPKILHYIHETKNLAILPKNIKSAIVHNLGRFKYWDFRLYTPEKLDLFVSKEFPEYETVYSTLTKYRQKNFTELLLLYRFGGLTTDISVKLTNMINRMIQNSRTFVIKKDTLIAISCPPEDKVIKNLIELYQTMLNEITPQDIIKLIRSSQDVTIMK